MPRQSKIIDTYEKISFSSKLFMYVGQEWNNISPVVEIIKNLNKNSIISYKYGKGQSIIRTYGTQYFHHVMGCEFKNHSDYINNIVNGFVKFIFIFSDTSDFFTNNLVNLAKKYKIVLICYSNIDSIYHFYNYFLQENNPIPIKSGIDVVSSMNQLHDYLLFKQVVDTFPDFDLIPENINNEFPVLERCLQILKDSNNTELLKKDKKKIQIVDNVIPKENNIPPIAPNSMNSMNSMSIPTPKPKMLLSQFFKKNK